jgi:hypothetical protein
VAFPNRLRFDSRRRRIGSSPCRLDYGRILTRGSFVWRRSDRGTADRRVGFWLLRRSTKAPSGLRRPSDKLRLRRDRRCDASNRARLGDEVQRAGASGADRPQGARPEAAPQRGAAGGVGQDDRRRPDSCDPRRRALAACRSLPMGIRRVSSDRLTADDEPPGARSRVSQTLRQTSPSRPGGQSDRGF